MLIGIQVKAALFDTGKQNQLAFLCLHGSCENCIHDDLLVAKVLTLRCNSKRRKCSQAYNNELQPALLGTNTTFLYVLHPCHFIS